MLGIDWPVVAAVLTAFTIKEHIIDPLVAKIKSWGAKK